MILSLLYSVLFLMTPTPIIIFDFTTESDLSDWRIMDDVVMGGRSDSNLQINEAGHGWFHGFVSLENNGGFASTRYNLKETLQVEGHTTCKIRLKADGKAYQFRTKESQYDRYSYIYTFETTGEWETVEIPLSEMYASFRGRRLDRPNYPARYLDHCAILIANKKNESFEMEIDRIWFE